jgi:serine/threonine protein kinase
MPKDDLEEIARKICKRRGMRFLQPVGAGAFKQTFQVVGTSATPLALKLYKASSSNPRDQREIDAMLRCHHPNIARLLSVEKFSFRGHRFVAMTEEFLSGGTLTSKGQVGIERCFEIGLQLIEGLAYIAALSLVHRDIKPDNIMFRSDGLTPVITDFGVVRDLLDSSITPTWAPRGPGTPFFAGPEQLNNEKNLLDWRADQFALGISLAYATFGDHPYRNRGLSDRDVVERVSTRSQPAKWFAEKAASVGLASLTRMVEPWPIDRYRKPDLLRQAWREHRR